MAASSSREGGAALERGGISRLGMTSLRSAMALSLAALAMSAGAAFAFSCPGPKDRFEVLKRGRMVDFDLLHVREKGSEYRLGVYFGNHARAPLCENCRARKTNKEGDMAWTRDGFIVEVLKETGLKGFPAYIHVFEIDKISKKLDRRRMASLLNKIYRDDCDNPLLENGDIAP
ncbi:exported hypothetical protein [Hyphomicrobiales bacterium]|nr:exported hypothetical protein [Hyphomicrobiales bacterium]CAH1695557.1 exported hypothetical protein [Hyphomicrobiales bacterium]